jgi:hypothetical protein
MSAGVEWHAELTRKTFPFSFFYPERDGRRSVIPAFVEDTTSVALLAATIPAWRAQLTSSLQPLDPENDAVRHMLRRGWELRGWA